jgi:hypothetical protein
MGRGAAGWRGRGLDRDRNRNGNRQTDGERGRRVRTRRCSRCLLLDGRVPLRWSGRPKEFKRLEAAAGARLALGEQVRAGWCRCESAVSERESERRIGESETGGGQVYFAVAWQLSGAVDAGVDGPGVDGLPWVTGGGRDGWLRLGT